MATTHKSHSVCGPSHDSCQSVVSRVSASPRTERAQWRASSVVKGYGRRRISSRLLNDAVGKFKARVAKLTHAQSYSGVHTYYST